MRERSLGAVVALRRKRRLAIEAVTHGAIGSVCDEVILQLEPRDPLVSCGLGPCPTVAHEFALVARRDCLPASPRVPY